MINLMTEKFQHLKYLPADSLGGGLNSARGLAHSKTLRAVLNPSKFAAASWTAVALHRFSLSA
jgi:hypothetical protein